MVELYIHSPIRLHGVGLNLLSTGTTLQKGHSFPLHSSASLSFCYYRCKKLNITRLDDVQRNYIRNKLRVSRSSASEFENEGLHKRTY
jgi:hypothetical protein